MDKYAIFLSIDLFVRVIRERRYKSCAFYFLIVYPLKDHFMSKVYHSLKGVGDMVLWDGYVAGARSRYSLYCGRMVIC